MRERLAEFALTLHREKTRLIEFGRLAARTGRARSRQTGDVQLPWASPTSAGAAGGEASSFERKSRRDRMQRQLQAVKEGLRRRMHETIESRGLAAAGGDWASTPIMPCRPIAALAVFRDHVDPPLAAHAAAAQSEGRTVATDHRTADRGSHAAYHSSLARQRFAVKHPRWEPDAGNPPVGFCAGGTQ